MNNAPNECGPGPHDQLRSRACDPGHPGGCKSMPSLVLALDRMPDEDEVALIGDVTRFILSGQKPDNPRDLPPGAPYLWWAYRLGWDAGFEQGKRAR